MSRPQHVLLVPGFFGFAQMGDFAYFGHVREWLERRASKTGGVVHVVRTSPTATLAVRAARIAEALGDPALAEGDLHLIGHSSGGIDIRALLSPGAELPTTLDVQRLTARVRTALSLSSPHYGSPLAGFLTSILGPQLLKLLSLVTIYTLRTGRVPIAAVAYLTRLTGARRIPVAAGTLIDQIYRDLLSDFSEDRRVALDQFFVDVGRDQGLLVQLTPTGMALVNQALPDRPGVRYGSVVTLVDRPGLRSVLQTGPNPFRQATHALFAALQRITARVPDDRPLPLQGSQARALDAAFGVVPQPQANDGMVPTRAQVWGEIVHATYGDHLDTLGHFYLPQHVPPHFDWLNSGAQFSLGDFERLWAAVWRFIAD